MTWHQKYIGVHEKFQSGDIEKADQMLASDDKIQKGKNRILYLLDRGVLNHMMGNYDSSIRFFKEADIIIEDYRKRVGNEALALITNPMTKPYLPEDFEVVMINFYQSMNFISKGDWESALVECRRANIKLNELNDKYKDHKNRYQRDAFIHTLMGLIYDAQKDYNNAFIAYRNALEIYESDFTKNFNIGAPEQLKWDILRTAYKTGFKNEVVFYEDKFDLKYTPDDSEDGELIMFWLNGLGPVKSEWGITLTKMDGESGWVNFYNEEMGVDFPFYVGDLSSNERSELSDLSITHIAFPKYVSRQPVYTKADLMLNDSMGTPMEIGLNIDAIAYKVLKDRMLRELGNSVLRMALKKTIENKVRQENENIGFLVGLINTATEKADTRNWQTLPYSISYTRLKLPEGEHSLVLKAQSEHEMVNYPINISIKKGKQTFYSFHTIDTYPYIP